MESYEGIKFEIRRLAESFTFDDRLERLNEWIFIFGELGLAPVHPEGAFGNHSYRLDGDSFIITRTGMVPKKNFVPDDFCLVRYDEKSDVFLVEGSFEPSSESFLHYLIYSRFSGVNVIMHGHCQLLNTFAGQLGLAVSAREFPYGTKELAESAAVLMKTEESMIMMKNHGFVTTGIDIDSTARRVLTYYGRLIDLLKCCDRI